MTSSSGHFGKLFDLTGKVAVITGAAVGFGRVISQGFAEYGADIVAADIDGGAVCETVSDVFLNFTAKALPRSASHSAPRSAI